MRFTLHVFLFGLVALVAGCTASSPRTEPAPLGQQVLMTVGEQPVLAEELLYVYQKNNRLDTLSDLEADLRSYMDLFITFKRKVAAAYAAGYQDDPQLVRELSRYKYDLAEPYLQEDSLLDFLVQQAYDRLQTDINASHILVEVKTDATAADTLAAYEKALDLKRQAEEGAIFAQLARDHSDDPSVANNAGVLGWFSALTMVYPFESAAYGAQAGQVVGPVRTSFGYHVIRVEDRRPTRGRVLAGHIFLPTKLTDPQEVQDTKEKQIRSIYEELENGGEFSAVAAQYSQDPQSAQRGGKLGWISSAELGSQVPNLSEALFRIDSGSYSEPVRTPYGWHILYAFDKGPFPDFEEMKGDLTNVVKSRQRSRLSVEQKVASYKQTFGFEEDPAVDSLLKTLKPSYVMGKLLVRETNPDSLQHLFTIGQADRYVAKDLFGFARNHRPTYAPNDTLLFIRYVYEDFLAKALEDHAVNHLQLVNDDYRLLLAEYEQGMVLFEVMNDKVWGRAAEDTAGLEAFFAARQDQYQWGERMVGNLFLCKAGGMDQELQALPDTLNATGLAALLNSDDPLRCRVKQGDFELQKEEWLQPLQITATGWHEGTHPQGHVYAQVNELLPAGPKQLKECRGQVISDYQNHLEAQWLAQLKETYPVEVNEKVLQRVIDHLIAKTDD